MYFRKILKWSPCRTCFLIFSRRNPFFVVDGEGFFKLTLFQGEKFFLQLIYLHLFGMFFLRHFQLVLTCSCFPGSFFFAMNDVLVDYVNSHGVSVESLMQDA